MTVRRFALEPLSLPDVGARQLADIAAAAGFDYVSFVLQSPHPTLPLDPVVHDAVLLEETREAMLRTGLGMSNIECFNLIADAPFDEFRRGLECGHYLGARTATAIVWENADRADALRQYIRLCDMAQELDIIVNIEFISMSESLSTIRQAAAMVRDAGRSNAGIMCDLLHLMRTGDSVAEVRAIDPALIRAAQVADGPLELDRSKLIEEAAGDRLYPGLGAFPISEFIDALPHSVIIGIEVPRVAEIRQVAPLDRARRMIDATRAVLDRAPA